MMNGAVSNHSDRDALIAKIKNGVALIDFSADWCVPCREQRPIVERIADSYKGKAEVFDLNVDEHPDPAISLGITSIPTLIVFKNGSEFQRFIGIQKEETLISSLEAALND